MSGIVSVGVLYLCIGQIVGARVAFERGFPTHTESRAVPLSAGSSDQGRRVHNLVKGQARNDLSRAQRANSTDRLEGTKASIALG